MNTYLCCDEQRRDAVRAQQTYKGIDFNGIDYLEVQDETTLQLHLIHPLRPGALSKENVQITGGERIHNVAVVSVTGESKERHANILTVVVNKPGDYSTYTLSLSADPRRLVLDPLLSTIDFTFRLPTYDADCAQEVLCVPEAQSIPDIDYMAKDYQSFRQLMLDRLSLLMPQWQERSAADMGVMLVELLAYVADYLSYQQDVIATESYLSTARRRISARRHARLLDYQVNEGANARAWVQVQVNQDIASSNSSVSVLPAGTMLLTQVVGLEKVVLPPDSTTYNQAMSTQPTVFEPMMSGDGLFVAHNQISFYTWGTRECCLPKGSTSATLRGLLPNLKPGDVLIFKELVDPNTGIEEDAEPTHRHPVRLTRIQPDSDPLGTWPIDQSGEQDDQAGKVIAEYRIVEDDQLRVNEAEMSSKRSGHRVEKVEEQFEEEKRIRVQHYIIEKPDKSTITIDVRIRQHDRHVDVQLHEGGYAVQEEHQVEEVEETENHTEKVTEPVKGKERTHRTGRSEEDEEALEELAEEPTQKLPRLSSAAGKHEDVADLDTIELSKAPEKAIFEESKTQQEERTEKQHEVEEGEQEPETIKEKRTRVVHIYRIIREPDYTLPITNIEWGYEDALPFSLCISATTGYDHGHRYIEDVSVALGNIILADHGMTFIENSQQQDRILIPNVVPESTMQWASTASQYCEAAQTQAVPPRFYPRLKYTPLTFACPCDTSDLTLSAAAMTSSDVSLAVPAITLYSSDTGNIDENALHWQAQRDLLGSHPTDADFVVEVETDGSTFLRFGDDLHGLRPDPGTQFVGQYRSGNGSAGNIGRDALYHLVTGNPRLKQAVTAINNPMPGLGGIDPESIDDIREHAAGSLTEQARGVTPQDYIELAQQDSQVHRANAILRWTGSWYTVFLVVERVSGLPVDDAFKNALRQRLEQYRMTGTDLVIVSPVYVPLEIAMDVTIKPGYLSGDVQTELLKVFNNQQWPDGNRGVFYPDNFGFGQPVYLNPLYVAATAVPGVASVDITMFQREDTPGTGLKDGVLPMEWQELPILENNPSYPERGVFTIELSNSEVQYV